MTPSGDIPEVEREVVTDMVRRGLPLVPVVIGLSWLIWGGAGAASSGIGVGLVLVNFALAAALLSWGARTSPAALMGAALGGFLLRMVLMAVALVLLRDRSWIATVPLGITLLLSHVGLLAWELRRVSASLAFPGLKPSALNPKGA
jgi:hypothetical protein